MSRILYFDCAGGISGDMTLGALVHLSVDVELLINELNSVAVSGYYINTREKKVNGISGISLDVILEDKPKEHTSYSEIVSLIRDSAISEYAKELALNIFGVIARAEASVHDISIDNVQFHEVGAVDSIVDIVAASIAIDSLAPDKIYCSALADGSGTIECRHGEIPVPVPAVVEMLKNSDIRIRGVDASTELVTPTGMGILEGLGAECVSLPEMKVLGVGYGFGKRETGRFSGLRVIYGESEISEDNSN